MSKPSAAPIAESLFELLGLAFKPHPWHGLALGKSAPEVVNVYIEIVPTDTVKYEIEKTSGYLTIDRPQAFSNICPTLYGFLPKTYAGEKVAEMCRQKLGEEGIDGDRDPIDVCVLTEQKILHGNTIVRARPIGGLRMIDGNEADDKLIAVLDGDVAFSGLSDILDVPARLIDRLKHYFLTYKQAPDSRAETVRIPHIYGRKEAWEVISRSREDYREHFGDLQGKLLDALRGLATENGA